MALSDGDKLQLSQAFDKLLRSVGIKENTFDFNSIFQGAQATTGPMTLYVDGTLGNDKNNGNQKTPFATIQAAIDSVPKRLKHPVNINVLAGNYAGFQISGFVCDYPTDPTIGSFLVINGTLVTATLASGVTSGTITSSTAGSTVTLPTATVSGAGWTVNDLKGRLVEITAGTGVGNFFIITSNTATVLTLMVTAGTPVDGTSQFVIRDWGTNIISGISQPPFLLESTVNTTSLTGAAFISSNTTHARSRAGIGLYRLNLSPVLGSCVVTFENQGIFMKYCKCAAGTAVAISAQASYIRTDTVYVKLSGTLSGLATGTNGMTGVPSLFFASTWFVGNSSNGVGLSLTNVGTITTSGLYISGFAGASILANNINNAQILGLKIDGQSLGGVGISSIVGTVNPQSGIGLGIGDADISNCATAIKLQGPHYVVQGGANMTGTGNTVGIDLSRGASVQISSGSTITGTTEVTIDGTNTTLAAMRAASPKVVSNPNYFTKIFE